MQRTTATETLSSSWAKKLEIKAKRQAIMAMEKEMRDAKLQEIEVRVSFCTAVVAVGLFNRTTPARTGDVCCLTHGLSTDATAVCMVMFAV